MKYLRIVLGLLVAVPLLAAPPASEREEREEARRELRARLSGFQEVPTLVSAASGEFQGTISEDETSLSFKLSYEGFDTDVVVAHIHLGARATNGGVTINLCGTPDRSPCPARAGTVEGTITAANVLPLPMQDLAKGDLASVIKAIRAGATYANVHSRKRGGGEIRGQIQAREREEDE